MGHRRFALLGLAFVLVPGVAAFVDMRETSPSTGTDLRNGRVFIQDNLWSTAHEQYAVWVADDGTPYVGRRPRGDDRWQVVNLAALPGNPLGAPTADDEHNVYVVAADSLGFVHVIGNMHSAPLRYIRSKEPGDIHAWERATVDGRAARATYPRLVGLPDGTLLFWRREGRDDRGSILLDALAPGERRWRHVGTVLAGEATDEGPYLHHVAVDPRSGAVHLLFEWRREAGKRGNNDVGYARSRDGGRSWETSGGHPVATPMAHDTAETVIDTPPAGSGLMNSGGLAVDAEGRPHGVVVFHPDGGRRTIEHVWFDGASWRREPVDRRVADGRPAIAATRDGRMLLLGAKGTDLRAVDITGGARGTVRRLGRVPPGWEVAYDSQGLLRHGEIEVLVPDGNRPRVVRMDGR